MNRYRNIIFLFICIALMSSCRTDLSRIKRNSITVDRKPSIKPDYTGITIPPNIAPLNFSIKDSCVTGIAEITSVNGPSIEVWGKKGGFRIDIARWKRLLRENSGKPLHITIYTRGKQRKWQRYKTIENTIAPDPIDPYCTYRLLNFQYSYWRDLRECQRNLTSFIERSLVNTQNQWYNNTAMKNVGQSNSFRCVNCHIPMNNDPNRFVLQLRSTAYGAETLIADGDSITTLVSRLGHAAWHPSGKYIAFVVYNVQQYFHAVGEQFIDVYDNNSYIVIYDVKGRKLISVPQL